MISILSGILLLPLIISSVGSAEYGVWLILSAVATYLQLTDFGVGAAIVHFNSRTRGGKATYDLGQLLGAATAWNSAAALVVLPIFAVGVNQYLSSSRVRDLLTADERTGLLVFALVALGVMLLRPFDAALVSQGWLPRERAHYSIGLVFRILGTVAVCLCAPSILWIAAIEAAAFLIPSFLSFMLVLRSGVRVRWNRRTVPVLRFIMRFSSRAFGAGAIGLLILQGGTVLAGVILSPQEATYFNAAFRVYQGVRNLASWTTQPFRSAQSRLFVSDPGRALDLLFTVSLSSLMTTVAVSGGIALSAPFLVSLWLGDDVPVREISSTLVVLLAGVVLNSIHGPLVNAGDAAGRPGVFVPIQALWLALFVVLAFVLGPAIGVAGIAVALSAPLVVVECVYVARAGRLLGFERVTWLSEVLWPVVRVCAIPAAGAMAIWFLVPSGSALSLVSSLMFGLGAGGFALFLSRRDETLRRVAKILKVEL